MGPDVLQATGDAAVMAFTVVVSRTCSFPVATVTAVQVKATMRNNGHYIHCAK